MVIPIKLISVNTIFQKISLTMNLAGSDSWSYQATLDLVGPMDHDGFSVGFGS